MRATLWLVSGWLLLGCGSKSGPLPDRDGDVGNDGGGDVTTGNPDAPATSCPSAEPKFGATCAGVLSCQYGKSSCCGIASTAQTCTCQFGFFSCSQTVECNFICPDAGAG